jgi:CHASE2 domain-containing sensor protein
MVSWGYAFKRGFVIWLWTILWSIIGGIVALVISGGSLLAYISNPSAGVSSGALLGIIAGVFIGGLIALIGGYAAIVKIILDSKSST